MKFELTRERAMTDRHPSSILWAVLALVAAGVITCAGASASPKPRAYADPAGRCHAKAPCYRSIQAAVDGSAPHSVIRAYPGVYHEHVALTKALTLNGRGATIAGGNTGILLSTTGNGVVIDGLRLVRGQIGVALRGASANRLANLKIARVETGIFFSGGARDNLVTGADVGHARRFAIDVGDQNDSGNRFLRLTLHDSAKGFNAYRGSDDLVLKDSSIRGIAPGPGVVIGWSAGWTIAGNVIAGNASGILTDSVRSGSIEHNRIAGNAGNGLEEAGIVSTVNTRDNRIEGNGRSGIALCIAARDNRVRHNMVVGNGRYGVEICAHPSPAYSNVGNVVSGNYLFAGTGAPGDASNDQGPNTWAGNYYSRNLPWSSPFAIPGAALTNDTSPLTVAGLPTPATRADCRKRGWWLLTDGLLPFQSENACLSLAQALPEGDRDCSDFASQRDAQIFYLEHGGPAKDPDRLDGDHDGVACERNPCPCYTGSSLPKRAHPRVIEWPTSRARDGQ